MMRKGGDSRISTGICGLDPLLGGGFIERSVNAVIGTTGCGKTIFCLNFLLEGLDLGEKCVYVSFDLEKDDFLRLAESMHWDLSDSIATQKLTLKNFCAENMGMVNELLSFVKGCDRVVIDSFSPMVAQVDYSSRYELSVFFKELKKETRSILITLEEPTYGVDPSQNVVMSLVDSLIALKYTGYEEPFNRVMRIIKHRMSWHAEGLYPYSIVEGIGIVLEERRGEPIEDVSDFDKFGLPETALTKIRKLCENGYLTIEDIEKIKRRIRVLKNF